MQKLCLLWVLMAAACGGLRTAESAKPQRSAGPRIVVRTLHNLSANTVSPGERIEVELAEPVVRDGAPPVPEAAKAVLHVVDVDQGMRGAGRALLRLRLTQLRPSLSEFIEVHTRAVELAGTRAQLAAGATLAFELASPVTTSPRNAARR